MRKSFRVLSDLVKEETTKKAIEYAKSAIGEAKKAQSEFQYSDKNMQITLSFGVAIISDVENSNQCIICADKALYSAKKSGRNMVVAGRN